jgi:hypothetical protein
MAIYPNPNYYNTPYQPYTPPVQSVQSYNVQPDSSIIWVQGESGAKAYPVQNGKSVVLFDSESEHFFIKTADASGMPQPLRIFNYSETNENEMKTPAIDTSQFITRDEFEEVIEKLKSRPTYQRKETKSNVKPSIYRADE